MTWAAYYNARVRLVLLSVISFCACNSSSVTLDAGVPLDMHVAAPTTLTTASTLTNCLAADASFVFWSDSTPAIMKVPVGGGNATQVIAGGDKHTCVAVDGSGVY